MPPKRRCRCVNRSVGKSLMLGGAQSGGSVLLFDDELGLAVNADDEGLSPLLGSEGSVMTRAGFLLFDGLVCLVVVFSSFSSFGSSSDSVFSDFPVSLLLLLSSSMSSSSFSTAIVVVVAILAGA